MSRLRRCIPTVVATLLLITLASLSLSGVSAQAAAGTIDQQCSAVGGSYLDGVGVHQPAGQTMIPTQSSMTGLAFFLRSDNPTSTSMTATIISNGILGVNNGQGNLVGSVTFNVPALFGQPSGGWLNVPLPSGVVLNPGAVYAISLVDNSGSGGIKWSACSAPYANGCGFANGQCQAYAWAFMDYYGDFSVAFSTTGISIAEGASGTVNLYVASVDNFASPVSLTFSAPPGVTASFNGPSQIETAAGGTSSPTVTIYVSGTVAPGTYPFTVKAFSGGISHSAILQLMVTPTGTTIVSSPGPDFLTQPSPAVMALTPDVAKSTTIVLSSVNGFSSSVGLSAAWTGLAPDGVTVGLPSPVTVPADGSASSTVTLTADNSPSTGTYTLLVTATNGVVSHSSDVVVTITGTPSVLAPVASPDFSINSVITEPSPAVVTLTPGMSSSDTIVLSSVDGLSSAVSLTAGWSGAAPDGVAVTLSTPVTVPSSGSVFSTLTLTSDTSPSTGTYTLIVTASNGVVSHSTEIEVAIAGQPTVLAPVTPLAPVYIPDFSVAPTSDTVSTIPGLNGGSSVTVNSLGSFSSPVIFSASWVGNEPTGIAVTLPQTVTPPAGGEASSPISFTTTPLASTGTYILQVTGTSGSVSHSTDITLQVNPPGPFLIGPALSRPNR